MSAWRNVAVASSRIVVGLRIEATCYRPLADAIQDAAAKHGQADDKATEPS